MRTITAIISVRAAGVETHKRAPENCDEKNKTFGEVVLRTM